MATGTHSLFAYAITSPVCSIAVSLCYVIVLQPAMEYSNVNPPTILQVSVGANAPQHGPDAGCGHKVLAYISEDPVISSISLFTLASVCILAAGNFTALHCIRMSHIR
jgi:hypothetical protein